MRHPLLWLARGSYCPNLNLVCPYRFFILKNFLSTQNRLHRTPNILDSGRRKQGRVPQIEAPRLVNPVEWDRCETAAQPIERTLLSNNRTTHSRPFGGLLGPDTKNREAIQLLGRGRVSETFHIGLLTLWDRLYFLSHTLFAPRSRSLTSPTVGCTAPHCGHCLQGGSCTRASQRPIAPHPCHVVTPRILATLVAPRRSSFPQQVLSADHSRKGKASRADLSPPLEIIPG